MSKAMTILHAVYKKDGRKKTVKFLGIYDCCTDDVVELFRHTLKDNEKRSLHFVACGVLLNKYVGDTLTSADYKI